MVELTHGGSATTIDAIALATSATTGFLHVHVVCRATSAFTGGSVGDSWAVDEDYLVRNVSGTLTSIGSPAAITTLTDTSVNGNALTLVISGTNANVTVTPPNVAAGVEDCQSHDAFEVD
jgi:hypothetical protein